MSTNASVLAELNFFLGNKSEFSLDVLRHYFKIRELDIPDATIRWRVHEMVENGILFLKNQFPLISYCVGESGLLNEFAQHLSSYQFILVDIERDVAESVYYKLKQEFSGTFIRPTQTLLNDILPDFRLPLVVRYLTSESPVCKHNDMPIVTIENAS